MASQPLNDAYTLAEAVSQAFDNEEIDDLAFFFGIEPENIIGQSRSRRAISLVNNIERRGIIGQFVGRLQQLRPNIIWPN